LTLILSLCIMGEAGNDARAKLILPHKDAKLYKHVVREKDSALVMASQIEDDILAQPSKAPEHNHVDWTQKASLSGRKLDIVPSYDEIMDSSAESSQSSLSSHRRLSSASPSLVSQSQPARTRKIRVPFFNTQKSHEIIDLEELEDATDLHQLIPATAPSPAPKR
jgi:hypothetical protein